MAERRGVLSLLLVAACSSTRPSAAGDDGNAAAPRGIEAGIEAGTASSDAGATPAPGTFCAARSALFCDDFDTPSFSERSWVVEGAPNLALPGALSPAYASSPPNAFVSRTPAIADATGVQQQLRRSAGGPDAVEVTADFSFSLRVITLGASPRTEVARVEGVNPIDFTSHHVALLLSRGGAEASIEVSSGPSIDVVSLLHAPPPNAWSRVTIHLVLERTVNGPATSIAVQIGDAPAETISLERGMGVRPFLRLGLAVSGPSTPSEIAYDDVTYDAR
ncbi:MAG: hypothetical protein U0270_02095 [Labilithrix sp.]